MAISPVSDLILDVARAADPQKALATTRALASASSGADATAAFSGSLDSLRGVTAPTGHDYSYRNPVLAQGVAESPSHKAAVGLESVLLKSFVDQMLPKGAVDVFGGGVAGDIWKSMLSEKVANEVAKSGSLKLSSRLFETHPDLLHSTSQKMTGQVQAAPATNRT